MATEHPEPIGTRPQTEAEIDLRGGAALSQRERAFCREFVLNGGNASQAALSAGYGAHARSASVAAARCMARPRVLAEIKRLMVANISAHLPASLQTLISIATDNEADERARVMAANSILDRGGLGTKNAVTTAVQVNIGSNEVNALKREIWQARSERLAGTAAHA